MFISRQHLFAALFDANFSFLKYFFDFKSRALSSNNMYSSSIMVPIQLHFYTFMIN